MVLHLLIFFLFIIFAESVTIEGNPCTLTNGSHGVCTSVNNCQSVLAELMAGNTPDKLCGYAKLEPILCCPTSTLTTTASSFPKSTESPAGGSWINDQQSEDCSLTNGSPGICTVLEDCRSVIQDIRNGKAPDKLCGFNGRQPIVCCPSTSSIPTVNTPNTILSVVKEDSVKRDGGGIIARQKCMEYASSVYTLMYPTMLEGFQRPINVSQCAIKSQQLIVGETKAKPMEFPHMAAIGYNLETAGIGWYCSGTLISETFVLTAAHCTISANWGNAIWVRVGDLNLKRSDDGATPVDRRIVERIRHPSYRPPSQYNDIALLRLESQITFNNWIRPACLYNSPSIGTDKAIATGWGRVTWAEDSGDLLKVTLPLVNQSTCNASYTSDTTDNRLPNGVNRTVFICAGESGGNNCQGDSGGPLVIYSKPEYHCMYDIVGVTSLGKSCGSHIPGIYTRVYNYIPWIENTVWGNPV